MSTSRPQEPRGMQPPDRRPVRITVPENGGKPRYGDPFWPKAPFQAIFYIAAIFGALVILAVTNPAPLQDPADPLNHAAIDPRPEWYFMFLFQLLKYFPGQTEVIGTVVIPGILTVALLLLPFYDRNWARNLTRRPAAVGIMSIAMLAIIWLTWGGLGFPTPAFTNTNVVAVPPGGNVTTAGAISPQVNGIIQQHCAACHISQQLGGLNLSNYAGMLAGGNVVPGPVVIPGDHAKSVIYQITQPKGPWPGGNRMPLGGPYLSATDLNVIASWIDGLPSQGKVNTGAPGSSGNGANGTGKITGGKPQGSVPTATPGGSGAAAAPGGTVSFKNDVQPIFQQHCAACHIAIQSGGLSLANYQGLIKGGNIVAGPIVKAGDPQHSVLYEITSPSGPYPGGNRMPLGGPYLSSGELQTIQNWITQGAKDN